MDLLKFLIAPHEQQLQKPQSPNPPEPSHTTTATPTSTHQAPLSQTSLSTIDDVTSASPTNKPQPPTQLPSFQTLLANINPASIEAQRAGRTSRSDFLGKDSVKAYRHAGHNHQGNGLSEEDYRCDGSQRSPTSIQNKPPTPSQNKTPNPKQMWFDQVIGHDGQQQSQQQVKMTPDRIKLLDALAVNLDVLAVLREKGLVSDDEVKWVGHRGGAVARDDGDEVDDDGDGGKIAQDDGHVDQEGESDHDPYVAQTTTDMTMSQAVDSRVASPVSVGERQETSDLPVETSSSSISGNESRYGYERYTHSQPQQESLRDAPVRPRHRDGGDARAHEGEGYGQPYHDEGYGQDHQDERYIQPHHDSTRTTPVRPRQHDIHHPQPRQKSIRNTPDPPRPQNNQISNAPSSRKFVPAICFFWYHVGQCNKDPQSPNYDGSSKICRHLHFINRGMEDVLGQHVPRHFHEGIGDCRLDRCPYSSTYMSPDTARQDWRAREMGSRARPVMSQYDWSGGDGQSMQAPSIPSTPVASTTSTPLKNKKGKKAKQQVEPTPSGPFSTPTGLKRKAILPPPSMPTSSRKKQKQKCGPTAPPSILSTITDLHTSKNQGHIAKTSKDTCFFWYHDTCAKSGKRCERIHALTNPPKFVQPPRGYVHREKCFREWCPGDWMWDHSGHGDGGEEESVQGEEEEVELEYDEDGEDDDEDMDDEWVVQGFPDA